MNFSKEDWARAFSGKTINLSQWEERQDEADGSSGGKENREIPAGAKEGRAVAEPTETAKRPFLKRLTGSCALPVLPLSEADFETDKAGAEQSDEPSVTVKEPVAVSDGKEKAAEPILSVAEPVDEASDKETAEAGSVMSAFEWVEAAVFALIAIALVFAFLLRTVGVDGDSMNNTLLDQDKLILSSYPYTPQRGDIVVISRTEEEPLIKRVIAVEGDTLDIDEETGDVILNGKVLDEPYLDCKTNRVSFSGEVVIPEGCVFVMGDNRPGSHDSRYADIGFVSVSDIMGKALLRIAPLSEFGSIY